MNPINKMGWRVVGMTTVVVLVVVGIFWGGQKLLNRDGKLDTTPSGSLSLTDRTQDSDGDGMADLYETAYYGTDPHNPDTDGDGMSDRDEILAGRDPLIPGPNDASKPATGAQITQVDTFTKKYLASLPEDIPREQVLDQVRLEAFVEANKGTLLEPVTIRSAEAEGKEAISAYLDAVSSTHNKDIGVVTSADVEAAFRLLINTQDKRPMQGIVDVLNKNVTTLRQVPAPNEVSGLHEKMIAATQALLTSSESLLNIDQDFVGGLIAAKKIEELGSVFQEMANSVRELETKYGLE
jgi:hypothetical protein